MPCYADVVKWGEVALLGRSPHLQKFRHEYSAKVLGRPSAFEVVWIRPSLHPDDLGLDFSCVVKGSTQPLCFRMSERKVIRPCRTRVRVTGGQYVFPLYLPAVITKHHWPPWISGWAMGQHMLSQTGFLQGSSTGLSNRDWALLVIALLTPYLPFFPIKISGNSRKKCSRCHDSGNSCSRYGPGWQGRGLTAQPDALS